MYCLWIYWPIFFGKWRLLNFRSTYTRENLKLKVRLNKDQFHISGFRNSLLGSKYQLLLSFPNIYLYWRCKLFPSITKECCWGYGCLENQSRQRLYTCGSEWEEDENYWLTSKNNLIQLNSPMLQKLDLLSSLYLYSKPLLYIF